MSRIYYAHAMGYYGSDRERRVVQTMKDVLDWEVVNPNDPVHQRGFGRFGMGYFDALLRSGKFDGLAYEPFDDGAVGAGVAYEVEAAFAADVPVFVVEHRSEEIVRFRSTHREEFPWVRVLTRDETRAKCLEVQVDRHAGRF